MDYSWLQPGHENFMVSFSFWFSTSVMLASTVFGVRERNEVSKERRIDKWMGVINEKTNEQEYGRMV